MTTRTLLVLAVAAGLLGGSLGCAPLPPPHYDARYQLEYLDGTEESDDSVTVTGLEHQAEPPSPYDDSVPADLVVDLEIQPNDAQQDWTLARSDIELVADVPERNQLIADRRDERRNPDRLFVYRDGDWIEAESLPVGADRPLEVRVRFDGVLPYVEPERGDTRYYHPVDLHLAVPQPNGAVTRVALTDARRASPVWVRDSADMRIVTGVHATAGLFDEHHGSPGFGLTVGGHVQFTNDVYFRSGLDINVGALLERVEDTGEYTNTGSPYMQMMVPLMAGYNFGLARSSIGAGIGWAPSFVMRDRGPAWNLPHWGVAELLFIREIPRAYPYRTEDFHGDFGAYLRFMPQLGNLGPGAAEAPGFMGVFGFTFQPAAF